MSIIRIFRRTGEELAEIIATAQYSWLLNEEGSCTFALGISTIQENPEIIQYGNFVYIEHETLPVWGGVIDTPRTWDQNGVTITAYTGEHLLTYRYRLNKQTVENTAGKIYQKIIKFANKTEDLHLYEGEIWSEGAAREETLGPGNYYDDVVNIAKKSGNDWMVLPVIENGKMHFLANWYKNLGEVTLLELAEGHNLELKSIPLREQGEIINELTGLGEGVTFDIRPQFVATDDASHAQYGRRQGCIQYTEQELTGTLKDNTKNELAKIKNPRVTLHSSVLNVGDTFSWLKLGNKVKVILTSVGLQNNQLGYTGMMKIVGMTVSENSVDIVSEEIYDD